MHAHEARSEFLFETGKRFFQKELAVAGANGDVLELGLEIDDFLDGDEDHARAFRDRQKAPRRGGQAIELLIGDRTQSRHFLKRGEKPLHPHRLHQIVDGVDFECCDRVLVIRGREYQHRGQR